MADTSHYTVKKTPGRNITPEQLKRLIALAKQLDRAEAGYEGAYGLKPRGINEDFFTNKLKRQTAYLASDGKDTVGMALSTPSSADYDNDIDYINMVSVDEKHRGQGLGRRLLRAALRDSIRKNRTAMLRVNANNHAGLHLYESMGFKPFSHAIVYQGEKRAGAERQHTLRFFEGRKLKRKDVAALLKMTRGVDDAEDEYNKANGLVHLPADRKQLVRWLKSTHGYIAEDNGKPVGFINAQEDTSTHNATAIGNLYVAPEYRGKGIGRALLNRIISDNVPNGKTVGLRVNLNNPAGLSLYSSVGFKPAWQGMILRGQQSEKKASFAAKVASVLLKAAAVAAPTHAVAAGDTLSDIARRNGTTVQELARANAIKDPNKLRVGQKLRLPAAKPAVRTGRQQAGQVARADVRPEFPGKNNNPVNMRYYGVGWNGERPAGLSRGDFTRFDTPQNGARAGIRNLMTLGKRHGFTLNGVMPKFSPSSENDTGRHIKTISAISNIPPDKVLDPKNTGQMVDLLRGVIGAESGKKTLDWFQPVELTNAVLRAHQP